MQVGQIDRVFLVRPGHQAHAGARDFSQLGFDSLPLIERSNRPRDFGMNACRSQISRRGGKDGLWRAKSFE